jgi:hypothetical protein
MRGSPVSHDRYRNAAIAGADQSARDARAQRIGIDEDFAVGGLDGAQRQQRAILLGREANDDRHSEGGGCEQGGEHAGQNLTPGRPIGVLPA